MAALLPNFDKDFGERLKAARTSRGASQVDLLKTLHDDYGLDWAPSIMTKLEKGDRPARLSEAVALAHALHTTVDDLMFGSDYRRANDILKANDIRREEANHMKSYLENRLRHIEKVDAAQYEDLDAIEKAAASKEDS